MEVLEREDVKRALFWACVGALSDLAGTLLGTLAVLAKQGRVPVRELVEAAEDAGVSWGLSAHATAGLIQAGLARLDEETEILWLTEAGEEAARLATECLGPGKLRVNLVAFLRSVVEAGEKLLQAC